MPAWFGDLENLEVLVLERNPLTGSIPPELGNLTRLEELNLRFTVLTGALPASLTRLTGLSRLNLDGTGVCVPDDAAIHAWLAMLPDFTPSGLTCGESPAPATIAFEAGDYTATEGGSAHVQVRLSDAPTPPRAVTTAVTATAAHSGEADHSFR